MTETLIYREDLNRLIEIRKAVEAKQSPSDVSFLVNLLDHLWYVLVVHTKCSTPHSVNDDGRSLTLTHDHGGEFVCKCGLPQSRNPHPDAGSPTLASLDVGYYYECIPCTVKRCNKMYRNWIESEGKIKSLVSQLKTALGMANDICESCRYAVYSMACDDWHDKHPTNPSARPESLPDWVE